jgi:hypothetical protein
MAFVPEGQADSSQARSAWAAMQRGPVPGICLASYGPKWPRKHSPGFTLGNLHPPDLALKGPPGTARIGSEPCLATIVLSLRDKNHSPIEAPDNYFSAYGLKP